LQVKFIKTQFTPELIAKLQKLDDILKLHMVSNRGLLIWPKALRNAELDFSRFRFLKAKKEQTLFSARFCSRSKDLSIIPLRSFKR
jgi:hypothetical protein